MEFFRLHFSLSFPPRTAVTVQVWHALVDYLKTQTALPSHFRLSQITGHPHHLSSEIDLRLTPNEIEQTILDRSLTGFNVQAGISARRAVYCFENVSMWCMIDNLAKAPDGWSRYIELNLDLFAGIGGWQILWPYHSWQNAHLPDIYNTLIYGSKPPGLLTRIDPNDYGIGLEVTYIDVSLNPGRAKELASGVKFYPTAEMWLGPHFWQYAKCTKEEALAADFWLEARDTPNYTYFKCWPEAFSRPDGEQGRMQQRLWKLFFHEVCEWPPGSGTICNEPMYGPPELMPRSPSNVWA